MQHNMTVIKLPRKLRNVRLNSEAVRKKDGAGKENAVIPDTTGTVESLLKQIKTLETSLQNAREESYQAGYDEGRLRAEEEAKDRYAEFTQYLSIMERQWREALLAAEEPLIEMARQMAHKILQVQYRENSDFEDAFCESLGQILRKMMDPLQITVEISPTLAQNINLRSRMENLEGMPEKLRLVENSSLQPGECIVKSDELTVDARFETQLNNMTEKFSAGEIEDA